MIKRLFIFIFSIALLSLPLRTLALELYVWRQAPGQAGVVVPVERGQSPHLAAKLYINHFKSSLELADLRERSQLPAFVGGAFEILTDRDFNERVLILANMPGDIDSNGARISTFIEPLAANQVHSYVLPVAADLGRESQSSELIALLNRRFSAFVAMGGDDTDRTLFGQPNHLSFNTNNRRDRFEAALLLEKLRSIERQPGSNHRIFAVCRGAQLVASLMGNGVGLDIPTDLPSSTVKHGIARGDGPSYVENGLEPTHPIQLLYPGGILKNMLAGQSGFIGNTYHHQHIRPSAHAWMSLTTTAISPDDGVVEAAEYGDAILLVQFHPELMRTRSTGEIKSVGERIMRGAARFVTPNHGKDCEEKLRGSGQAHRWG